MEVKLQQWIEKIAPLNEQVIGVTQEKLDRLTKPLGSLGR